MRNTTKAIAALAAIAATMALGVSQASALTWSQTGGAVLGSLALTNGATGAVATCPTVTFGVGAYNSGGQAKWGNQGDDIQGCTTQGTHGQIASQLPIGYWFNGTTSLVNGVPTMTMQPAPRIWAAGPFGPSNSGFANLNWFSQTETFSVDVVNGNATTPTKVVFNNDKIGYTLNTGQPIYATGELQLAPFFFNGVPMGGVITLN